jgi:hypothetical protein
MIIEESVLTFWVFSLCVETCPFAIDRFRNCELKVSAPIFHLFFRFTGLLCKPVEL